MKFTLESIVTELYENFRFLPLVIQIAIVLTIVAITATIIAYVSILVRRWRGYVRERRIARESPRIIDLITEEVLLNPGLRPGVAVDDIQFSRGAVSSPHYKKRWVRRIMTDIFIQYRKNFTGEVGDLLRKLFMELELHNDAFSKLKSYKWEKKIQALHELTQMDIPISDVTILPLTNSKRQHLRVAARNAYIQLSKNEPFKFFDIATEPLLPWDQLEMFKIITTTEDIAIPNFSRWVSYSSNKSIISFCLKLIAHYNQQNAIPAILQLLDTRDHYLRANAINCLGKLGALECEQKLVSFYSNQPLNCQLEILKAIGRIGSGKYLDFLRHEFTYSSNFDVRMNAARSIIKHKTEGPAIVAELMNAATDENRLILKHVSNPLIKY